MTAKVYTRTKIKSLLAPIFLAYNVREARLFGSYAKNTATEKSDVDIYVDSNLKGLNFVGLTEAIRFALDKNVDIIDKTHIDPSSPVSKEIKISGQTIYAR